jgi:hypothetical protein
MNNTIRDYLINIYDKLSHKSTLLNGIALFKYLIKKEFYVNDKCNYIIKELAEQTNKLNGEDKKECLILLPYFFLNQISLKYLTKILYILFSQINHTTENIFIPMAKIFSDILKNVQSIYFQNNSFNRPNLADINNIDSNVDENNKYENILLRLCLDLIDNNNLECVFKSKYHDFSLENYQQKCGFLFLSQYIEHYNNLINDKRNLEIIINILKTHFSYLKNKNYVTRKELFLCINKLINTLKQDFSIYIKDILNDIYSFDKILSYSPTSNKIKNNDYIELKKYLLDTIYNILLYNNKKELIDDYKKILVYAKINKSNSNKDIRAISLKIIDIIDKENHKNDLNINNYISNDIDKNRNLFSKTIDHKQRALSFKNKESQIKKMINEDKKRYGDKKRNKDFIFVSQKSLYNSTALDPGNYFTGNKKEIFEEKKESKEKSNFNNLNVVNLKIIDIKNMNDTMIKAVNNIENYLNDNFNNMEKKLNRINRYHEENKNRYKYSQKDYLNNNNDLIIDNKVRNIILDDEKLVNFVEDISEKDINYISSQNYEQILNRLMILNLINKKWPSKTRKLSGLMQKLLDSKKIYIKNEKDLNHKSEKDRKYNISHNLENNLDYLFNSLNN